MKRIILFWLLCYGWLIGCQTNKGSVSPAVSQLPSVALSPTALVLATAPSTSPAATSLPSPTSTSSPTPLPTLPPTPTATATPFVNGEIYFLWNPEKLLTDPGLYVPSYNFYRAIPSIQRGEWTIQTLLEQLEVGATDLSPNNDRIAILTEHLSYSGYQPAPIYIYNLIDLTIELVITPTQSTGAISDLVWMSDGQTLLYYQTPNLFSASINTFSTPTLLIGNNSLSVEVNVGNSLNKNLIPLNNWAESIFIFNTQNNTLSLIKSNVGFSSVDVRLDPTEQWLAFTGSYNFGLWLVKLQGLECDQLVGEEHLSFPVWSPDGSWLTFNEGGNLYVWERQSQTVRLLATGGYFTQAAWSPDGQTLVVGVRKEDGSHLLFWDRALHSIREVDVQGIIPIIRDYPTPNGQVDSFVWAPDGNWILFPTQTANVQGYQYNIINIYTKETFPFINTQGSGIAYSFVWVLTHP